MEPLRHSHSFQPCAHGAAFTKALCQLFPYFNLVSNQTGAEVSARCLLVPVPHNGTAPLCQAVAFLCSASGWQVWLEWLHTVCGTTHGAQKPTYFCVCHPPPVTCPLPLQVLLSQLLLYVWELLSSVI